MRRQKERGIEQNFSSLSTGSTLNIFRTIFRFIDPFLSSASIGSGMPGSDLEKKRPWRGRLFTPVTGRPLAKRASQFTSEHLALIFCSKGSPASKHRLRRWKRILCSSEWSSFGVTVLLLRGFTGRNSSRKFFGMGDRRSRIAPESPLCQRSRLQEVSQNWTPRIDRSLRCSLSKNKP